MNNQNIFSGTIPALMTPCDANGTPDFAALVATAKGLIEAGMDAVVYCGSMGDWPLLTDEERMTGVKALVDAGIKTIVGTGAQNTRIAVAHATHAREIGAHGLMVIPRVLSRTLSPAAQHNHFTAILEAGGPDLPAVIYQPPISSSHNALDHFTQKANS
jgi:4-hydroxy-tetrahydrodipicolinate synthase